MRVARVLLLVVLIAAPACAAPATTAPVARLVDVPAVAPADGTAFLVGVRVEGAPGAEAELLVRWGPPGRVASRTWDGEAWARSDRYVVRVALDARGVWEGVVALQANPASSNRDTFLAGPAEVAARARAPGGAGGAEDVRALPAADLAVVPVAAAHVAEALAADGRVLLRAPAARAGALPALDGVAWLATPPGTATVRADGREAEPAPTPPPLHLAEVVPRGEAEALVLSAPEGGAACVAVAAARQCLVLPAAERVVLATDPPAYARRAGEPAHARLALGLPDAGGEARLLWGSAERHRLAWPRGGAADVVLADGATSRVGRTRLAPVPFVAEGGRVVVAPEDTFAAFAEVVAGAERTLVGSVYTLQSAEVAGLLADARRRDVDVRVLVEGSPVGGVAPEQEGALAALREAGAEVLVVGGPGRRYGTMHAKVLVADGRTSLVATENWNPGAWPPDGRGGNRGYAVVVESAELGAALEAVLAADLAGHDVRPWAGDAPPLAPAPYRPRAPGGLALGAFEGRLLLAPDHAGAEVADAVAAAREEVLSVALRLDPAWSPNLFAEAYLQAATQGARVRVLLAAPPEGRDNLRAAEDLVARATVLGLDLEARVETSARIRLLHGKLWIVDGERVLVGSLNGNRASVEDNREVVLDLASAEAARWLAAAFARDWEDVPATPAPGLAAALAAAGLALVIGCSRGRI